MTDAVDTAPRSDAFAVTVDDTIDVREGEWDGARGEREIFDWATGDDGEVDWTKASKGFGVADLNPPAGESITRASFKLAIAYVEGDKLIGIGNAIRNALARLPQTEGLSDAVRDEVQGKLEGMLTRLNEQTADALAGHFSISVDDARAVVDSISERLLALRDVERSEEEQAEIREEFPRLINGTPSQMREWAESPYSGENRKEGEARVSARDALRRVIALKEKPMSDWTEGDYDDAVKAIAFVKRMSEVEQGDPIVIEGREGPSERDASLRDWGHWTSDDLDALAGHFVMTVGDSTDRVYRTCTMDFSLDAQARVAVDRALAIADEIGPRTDAAQVKAIAEQLRADGFADSVSSDGLLIVTGYAARTGSQLYGDGKSTWYEYRSEAEVEKSLASYDYKTFTDDHPPVLVTSDNWREYARGMLGTGAELLPPEDDGHRYVKVKIVIGDVGTLRKIRDGRHQLSAGYTTIAVRDPGVDAHGVKYTYRQTDIQINHLARVDEGRAGPRARVQIDGAQPVFEVNEETTMATPTNDQMTPEAADALLDAINAFAGADSPEASEAAMMAIATATGIEPGMVKQRLGGGEMMEMDGVQFIVSKDAAAKIREHQRRITGDAAKIANDLATAQGQLVALSRTVDTLQAAKAEADMRDLEREISPLCPQLTKTWTGDARPKSLTAMRVAAILDLDTAAKVDLDKAIGDPTAPAPTYDAFVESLYSATKRHAAARQRASVNDGAPSLPIPKIDTSGIYGSRGTAN